MKEHIYYYFFHYNIYEKRWFGIHREDYVNYLNGFPTTHEIFSSDDPDINILINKVNINGH